MSETTPIESTIQWLQVHLARVQSAREVAGILVKTITVTVESSADGIREVMEKFEYASGDDIAELAAAIYACGAKDAETIGGGVYFLRIAGDDGSRHAMRFTAQLGHPRDLARAAGVAVVPGMAGRYVDNGNGPVPMPTQAVPYSSMGDPQSIPALFIQDKQIQLQHQTQIMEIAISSQQTMMQMANGIMKEQAETIRVMQKESVKGLAVMQELYDKKHEREMQISREKKAEERKDKALEMLEPMAMSVAARFFGAQGVPQGVAPVVGMMANAFKGMTQEQFQALMGSPDLTDDVKKAILEMAKVAQQVQAEKEGVDGHA